MLFVPVSLALSVIVSLIAPARKDKNVVTMDGINAATPRCSISPGSAVTLILIARYATWW